MFIRFLSVLILGFSSLGAKVSFNDEIRPLLSTSCYRCHGPDEEDRKAKLRLDTREGAIKNHKGFTAISPGKIEDSELIYRIVTDDEDEMMPPPGKEALSWLMFDKDRLLRFEASEPCRFSCLSAASAFAFFITVEMSWFRVLRF